MLEVGDDLRPLGKLTFLVNCDLFVDGSHHCIERLLIVGSSIVDRDIDWVGVRLGIGCPMR